MLDQLVELLEVPSSSRSSTRSRAVSLPSRVLALAALGAARPPRPGGPCRGGRRCGRSPQWPAAAAAPPRRSPQPPPARRRAGAAGRRRRRRSETLLLDVLAARRPGRRPPRPRRARSFSNALPQSPQTVLVEGHRRLTRALAPISFFAFSQSSRKRFRPMSVSGCLRRLWKTRRAWCRCGRPSSPPPPRGWDGAGWRPGPRSRKS